MDYFNYNERIKQKRFAEFRDKLLSPIILFFVNRNISKNMASFIGVGGLTVSCIVDPYQYWLVALIGLFFYLVFDAIDGGIARYTNTANENGSIIDIICDQLGVVLLTASSIYFYSTNSIFSLLYANSYIAFIVLVVYLNKQNVTTLPFVRVKYVFYLIYLITPFIEESVINYFITIFAVYYSVFFIVFIRYLK